MSKKLLALITSFMTLTVMCGIPAAAFAYDGNVISKDETVYVVTDSKGNREDVIVSDHLINEQQVKNISDETTLTDIENVKGDETFEQDGNSLRWAANGKDIFYQGRTDKEIPVQMRVSYKLDGKAVSGAELQNKSGNLEINIKYINNGKYEGKTVPFIVLTGMIITDDSFTDVSVDHGKVVDDGDKQVVVGMAAPGLAQCLDVGENKLGFGDSVRITGKAEKFAVKDMLTIATNSVFDSVDTGEAGNLDFDDEINQLNSGAKKLVAGSNRLYKGLNKMASTTPALKDGTEKIKNGSINIRDGVGTLGSQLNESMTEMCKGLTTIADTADSVKEGLEKIKSGITKEAADPASRPDDVGLKQAATLAKGAADEASEYAGDAVEASEDAKTGVSKIEGAGKDASEQLKKLNSLVDASGMDAEEKASFKKAIGALEGDMAEVDTGKNGVNNSISKMVDNAGKAKANADQASGLDEKIASGLDGIVNSLGTADVPGKTLIYAASEISKGSRGIISTIQESTTTGELAKGLNKLNKGSCDLADGAAELDEKTGKLVKGTGQLRDGSEELSKGMQKLYKKGIKKIVDLYNDDLKGLAEGLDDMMYAGRNYNTFTKLPSNMDGSVKFVYKTKIM